MDGTLFFEVYRDTAGRYRWRLRYGAQILAESAEAYNDKRTCTTLLGIVRDRSAGRPIVDTTADP
jgi:uncharacterized protein YegP (UPF0339 family)